MKIILFIIYFIKIVDLRSQQVKDTCQLLILLSMVTRDRMKLFLRDTFSTIFEGIKLPNKVITGYIDECILLLIRNVSFRSAIYFLYSEFKESKAKFVRERCLVRLI